MARSAGGNALVALFGQWGRYAFQLLALAVFSRLLTPSDIGLVAMVTAVVGIAYVVGDFGLSLAALQAAELSDGQRSNLFWWNAGIGAAVAGIVCAAAWPLSLFYDDNRVAAVTIALAVVFLINGLGVQFRTELNRRMRFGTIASADVAGQAAGFAVALAGAVAGWSFWALVAMQVVAALATNAILVLRANWLPRWFDRDAPMRELITFGGHTFLTQVVNYISANIDQVLVGRVWGAATLGFYNRAYQLARVPAQQIAAPLTRVALPYLMARLDDRAAYLRALQTAQLALTTLLLSLLAWIASTGDWLVPIALGNDWSEAVPILRALCLAGALQMLGYVSYWVLLSKARTQALFAAELWGRLVMIVLMVLVVPWGPVWVALAASVGQLLILAATTLWALPRADVPARAVFLPALRPAILFSLAGAASWTAGHALPGLPDSITLILATATFVAVTVGGLLVPRIRRDSAVLIALVRGVRRRGEGA